MIDRPAWDPAQYDRFRRQRDRAAFDLMAQFPGDMSPREIWDIGCGTGEHAAMLKRRWPAAAVHGLDASAEMLARARALPDAVEWIEGDAAAWSTAAGASRRPADLILANASLQWLGDHAALFARIAGRLAPGGVFACQMPMAWETRHHTIMRETAGEGPWAKTLRGVDTIAPLLPAEGYYEALADVCSDVDVWTTTYLQVLQGEDAVLEWMKGTALRPYLTALTEPQREPFLSALSARLSAAFPRRADGTTLLPFPRLFVIARR